MFKSSVLQIQKNEREDMLVKLSIKPIDSLKIGFCGEDLNEFFERKNISHPNQKKGRFCVMQNIRGIKNSRRFCCGQGRS